MTNPNNNASHNAPRFSNFFDLFALPVQFDVDSQALNAQLRQLQRQYHPDSQHTDADRSSQEIKTDGDEPLAQDGTSALINHAYHTLYHPDRRAQYLLELAGVSFDDNQTISDEDFLQTAMMIRIDMMETDDVTEIDAMHQQVTEFIESASQQFVQAYDAKQWQDAIVATQKLKFMVKLDANLKKRQDALGVADTDNDDDLYL